MAHPSEESVAVERTEPDRAGIRSPSPSPPPPGYGRASITPSSSSMPSDETATAAAPRSRSRSPSRALAPLLAALGGGAAVPASPELRECAAAEARRMHSLMPATVYCRRWRWRGGEAGAMAAVAAVAVAIVAVVVVRRLHEFAAERL